MRFSLDQALGIHPQALQLRSKRAEVLASNLANADTPNYKAKDFDFKQVMAQNQGLALPMKKTQASHIGADANSFAPELKYRIPLQDSLDGNSVDSHVEHAAFAENSVQYQASLQFLGARMKGLIKALRGE